jgi:hypothetical protein
MQLVAFPDVSQADQWAPNLPGGTSNMALSLVDSTFNTYDGTSHLIAQVGTPPSVNQTLCSGYQDSGPCQFDAPDTSLFGTILLPVCAMADQRNCVQSMSLGASTDALQPSTFVRMTNGLTVPADPGRGLPGGSTIGLWMSPVANSSGSLNYATYAMVHVRFSGSQFVFYDFTAAVLPYSQVSGSFQSQSLTYVTLSDGRTMVNYGNPPVSCAWTENGTCGRLQDFQPGTVASMTVRLSNQIGGWFKGRLKDPVLSVAPLDGQSNLVTVTAQSVQTPMLAVSVPVSQADSGIQGFFAQHLASGGIITQSTEGAFNDVDIFRTAASDTASGVVSQWTFSTVAASGNTCLTNTSEILGFVTTNAMVFDGTAPSFSNGQLDYQVGGMHYLPDGSLALGTYDLVIRSDVARCLYHYTSAPVSATIAVSNDLGVENVATTTVNESDGWLHLGAYGFTFSSPMIAVRLEQAVPPAPKAKKTTIRCVRGKSVKRVTAISPRCPAGYKRK